MRIAVQTEQWQLRVGHEKREVAGLTIDREHLVAFIDKRLRHVEHFREFYSRYAHYTEVFYEDISPSIDRCLATIEGIYGVSSNRRVQASLLKQNVRRNEDLVVNYEEVKEFDRLLLGRPRANR